MRSVPLTIITAATKRKTGRTRGSVGAPRYTLTPDDERHRRANHPPEAARLGRPGGRADAARNGALVRRLRRGIRRAEPAARGGRHVRAALRRQAAELVPGALESEGRGAR